MIRLAEKSDIPVLLWMGEQFFNESGYDDVTEFDINTTKELFESLIDSDEGYIVVVDDGGLKGMAGAMIYPFFFNANHIAGQELFWWIRPEYRGNKAGLALFKMLEDVAKDRGADSFIMMALEKLNPEFVGKIYESNGYRKSENTYIRRL